MKRYTIEVEDDEVVVLLKRIEGYEDVHPDLVSADAVNWPEYTTLNVLVEAPDAPR